MEVYITEFFEEPSYNFWTSLYERRKKSIFFRPPLCVFYLQRSMVKIAISYMSSNTGTFHRVTL